MRSSPSPAGTAMLLLGLLLFPFLQPSAALEPVLPTFTPHTDNTTEITTGIREGVLTSNLSSFPWLVRSVCQIGVRSYYNLSKLQL